MINFLSWCKKNQNTSTWSDAKKSHARVVVKFHNLVERQVILGRSVKSVPVAVPKVEN